MKRKLTPARARAMLIQLAEWFELELTKDDRVFYVYNSHVPSLLEGIASHFPRPTAKKKPLPPNDRLS